MSPADRFSWSIAGACCAYFAIASLTGGAYLFAGIFGALAGLAFIRATAPSPVQLRYYVPMTRRSVDRLLDRANAEGRTAVRCLYCGDAIEQLPAGLFGGGGWSTDYGARCPGRRAPDADGNWMHEPRPEQLNAL